MAGKKRWGVKYRLEIEEPDGTITELPDAENLLPDDFVEFVASLILNTGASPTSPWYVGLYENNYTPTADVAVTDLQTLVGESTAYDETERVEWDASYTTATYTIEVSTPLEFTMNADKTLYGAFIASNATKGSATGTLFSIVRFDSAQTLVSGSVFRISPYLILATAEA